MMRYACLLLAFVGTGCTHVQLRKNTVRQAWTVGDIYQLQVMNNLALFAYDPNSLPSFSYANQAGSNVTDIGSLGATPAWMKFIMLRNLPVLFSGSGTSLSASRSAQESFTMTPVNDPRKLELMRCAYQQALASCGRGQVSGTCPDCQSRFNIFYTGDEDGDIAEKTKGIVMSECLKGPCWFQVGCKKCMPKHCPCNFVGEYCGVYVWLRPGGRDQLAKLTLAILDYAQNSPPVPLTKTVVYYLDELGMPTTSGKAVSTVTANIAVSERNEGLLNLPHATEVALRDDIERQLQELDEAIAKYPALGEEVPEGSRENQARLLDQRDALRAQRKYLDNQIKIDGLKQPFVPSGGLPPGGTGSNNVILYGQTLNTLLPSIPR